MRWQEMDEIVETQFDRIREIRRTKGRDYAGDGDTLGNFKRTAEETGITPIQVWKVFANKHWDAISTYVRKGQVESEPIEARIDDALVYLLLLKGLIVEQGRQEFDERALELTSSVQRRMHDGTSPTVGGAQVVSHSGLVPGARVIPVRKVEVEGGDGE